MVVRELAVLTVAVAMTGCLSRSSWSAEAKGVDAPQAERSELERQREAAVGSGDAEQLAAYMRYLWQFDREHRAYLDRMEYGKAPKLPASLVGFDRQAYTEEALAAWQALRPAQLPSTPARETYMRAHFYAAALAGGCRSSSRALGPLLVLAAEQADPLGLSLELAMLESECGHAEGSFELACRAAADQIVALPAVTYADYDGDMWPDPPMIVRFASYCGGVLSDAEAAPVGDYHAKAEPWFAEHYPAEYAAWREEQRRIAEAMARQAAEREAQRQAQAAAAAAQSSQSSSGGGSPTNSGPVYVNLYNDCGQTVQLFFGDKPGFSSGTSTSLSANTSTSYSMREGEIVWIVQGGQGVSTYTASHANKSIKITQGCSGFAPR